MSLAEIGKSFGLTLDLASRAFFEFMHKRFMYSPEVSKSSFLLHTYGIFNYFYVFFGVNILCLSFLKFLL